MSKTKNSNGKTNTAPDISGMTIANIQLLVDNLHAEAMKPPIIPKPKPAMKGEWWWQVGANYHIRTGTHHYTGTFVGFNGPNNSEIVIKDAAWIPDEGRFTQAISTGSFNEVEPYPDGEPVMINRQFINAAVRIGWLVPRSQK